MNYQGHYAAGVLDQPSSTTPVDTAIEIQYFLIKANPNIDPPGFVWLLHPRMLTCRSEGRS